MITLSWAPADRSLQAAHGIGQAAVLALAEAGANAIVVADIDEAGARETAARSRQSATNPAYQVKAVALDVTQSDQVEAVLDKAASEFGRIDYLINSAGVKSTAEPRTVAELIGKGRRDSILSVT